MANVAIPMVLILFAFAGFASFLTASGMYDVTLPVTGIIMDTDASEAQQGALGQTGDTNYLELIRMFAAIIGEGILAALTVVPLLVAFGFPLIMVGPIIGPIQTFVLVLGLWELWTGRSTE